MLRGSAMVGLGGTKSSTNDDFDGIDKGVASSSTVTVSPFGASGLCAFGGGPNGV